MTHDLLDARAVDAPSDSAYPVVANARPRIAPTIVVANLALFAATLAASDRFPDPTVATLLDWGANFGPRTLHGQWWRLFTAMFLHFDLVHLALNMWVLWNVGRVVERLAGSFAFATLYLVSGLLGSVASLFWNPTVISAGASGAVFGVVGALFAIATTHRAAVPVETARSLRGSLIGFLGYNLLFGLLVPGIDMAAHLGGFAAGFFGGLACSQPATRTKRRFRLLRHAALLTGSAAVVAAAIQLLPQPPVDVQHQLVRFARLEGEAIAELDALSDPSQQPLSEDQLARRVQRDVQPVWRECQLCVQTARTAPLADQQYLARLTEYISLRQRSCDVLVQGLRERDTEKIESFNRLYESANRMAQQISQPSGS